MIQRVCVPPAKAKVRDSFVDFSDKSYDIATVMVKLTTPKHFHLMKSVQSLHKTHTAQYYWNSVRAALKVNHNVFLLCDFFKKL